MRDGRIELFAVFQCKTLCLGAGQVAAQSIDFLFHLGVLGSLAYALEVGFDLAFELESDAAGARLEGVLDDIAAELL